jgi:ABC-type nitrate/sulfonate/bicarbonate transport system ATPase subunit
MAQLRETKVKVDHLVKKFDDLLVLNDISFDVKKGEFLCIVGPTGCGKSTFLNCLSKLIPTTSGDILIDGKPANPNEHSISYVFQEPSNMPWKTVEENVKFGMELKGLPADLIATRAAAVMEKLGLTACKNYYTRQLSVSMAQRVVIARAFAMKPDLLIMDEPYGQLDIKLRYFLEDEVIRIWKDEGTTIIFVTHNIEEAVYVAERILVLTPKPSTIKTEILVDLPHPRNIAGPEFVKIREQVTDLIKWW